MTKWKRVEAWAVLGRDCTMTVVQDRAAAAEWAAEFDKLAPSQHRIVHLTERTPAEARELRALRRVAKALGYYVDMGGGESDADMPEWQAVARALARLKKGRGR